jgi:ABC-type nitrate/sulfonate/bicarbonate transport system permease component
MVFALLVVLALVGYALYGMIEWLDRKVVHWRGIRAA